MPAYLSILLFLTALLVWILRPRGPQRSSHPGAGGSLRGFVPPPEDFSAFMWMAALPPRWNVEAEVAPRRTPSYDAANAASVLAFWREAGPARWFAKDAAFDRAFRERFLPLHEAAARGELLDWLQTPDSSLALLILLDQFPRNAFRGTPRMYATDGLARLVADRAIERGHDQAIEVALRLFVYLPFAHSELLADQERSLALNSALPEPSPRNARRHHDIIQRFGRFPHRNPILGRAMRPEEQTFLDEGGYAG